ncbi:MAG: hypothetical protein M3R55_07965 [Acidobacteriota bacterium]|nr:hypothetical protein [Acidobacteriota bacterium]
MTVIDRWFEALEQRHLAELEWAEVTRALRALSSAYVQRRATLARGAALDGRGKRAAFAMFYGPLHFAAVSAVVEGLRADGAAVCGARAITDLGAGTGAAGAAWSLACTPHPRVTGVDIHPWAVTEATWTYRHFAIDGRAVRGDAAAARVPAESALIAAYTLNELDEATRGRVLSAALASRQPLLIVEPIARGVTPWWNRAAADVVAEGGRSDDWKLPLEMPERWRLLDRAAGFRRDYLSARSLWRPAVSRG